ncbi:hypothetical protein KOR34_24600 [Posidoniimonas corsicana]|uniref:DUF1573 domain-containing protein n=1 Tax=Posidoniimonas corsicana TaxID=1938618 RepID=A0A5C5VFS9_9BACT|nr:DUF1573 domain-containing protein [Posidoniimonas corsicana]TWT37508.1 hypothetical protein KOR34_24600 [Posidoniimonas corsicana]
MHLRVCLILLATLVLAPACHAQQWAKEMFDKVDHDFGAVARGSDTVYRFEVTNKYKEDIRLLSVRSSCGCTSPSIETTDWIKTWEKGYVLAKFNTRTFTGLHSATLTVDLEVKSPKVSTYRGQVQLRVHGNIRGDVVFEPGAIVFGEVDQGDTLEKRVTVTHSGRSSWKIEDVRSASDNLEVELTERHRSGGRVVYDLLARLKEGATPGLVKEQLAIVTNDSSNPRVPIDVEGRIVPEISVAPANLVFGKVEEGQSAKKRLIVRGKTPFRVVSIECENKAFRFSTDEDAKEHHIVTVEFDATAEPGDLKAPIIIRTDRGDAYAASCTAYATIEQSVEQGEPEKEVADATQGAESPVRPIGGSLAQDR